ncbi:MAG: aminotransferase class V-fold PLP-dependent enzyme [Anaerovoracaceae bacterium]
MKTKKGVANFLESHAKEQPISFHMPGHKGAAIYRKNGYGDFLDKIMDCDVTEIQGADNLFQTEGIILETMEKYKNLYDVTASYLLINGSSGGLIAAIMATVPEGKKIVMARNSHKSIFNALNLAKIQPVYAYPELTDFGILGQITPTEIASCLDQNPNAEAVILPSPNYYGICSDIKAIAKEVHSRGKVLIVDQAHGAHLKFFDEYVYEPAGKPLMSAENLGADLIINSTHKTLASFTQSAILNVNSDRIDKYLLEDKLQLMESTSPSYILMASLDINADLILQKGKALILDWENNLNYFYKKAKEIKGLKVMNGSNLDNTKINLDMSELGIDGTTLEKLLIKENIFVELVTGNIVMCMTGIGNTHSDYEKLLVALEKISTHSTDCAYKREHHDLDSDENKKYNALQQLSSKKLQLKSIPRKKKSVPIDEAFGKVSAASIIPYPPGIPIICPGEVMDQQVLAYVKELRHQGYKVMGINAEGKVIVGE